MEIQYIKNNKIEPKSFADDHNIKFNLPTFVCGFPESTFLMLTGNYKPEKYLYIDKIPSNVKVIRVPVPEHTEAGVICYFKDTAKIDLHIPRGVLPVKIVEKALIANVIRTLKLQKYNIIYKNNDLLIKIDNKLKKFCGFFHCELNGWDYYALPVSFKIDYNLARDVYRLDTEKMLKKGDIKDISDVIIGLDEVGITSRETFIDLFIENISKRFDWNIINSNII